MRVWFGGIRPLPFSAYCMHNDGGAVYMRVQQPRAGMTAYERDEKVVRDDCRSRAPPLLRVVRTCDLVGVWLCASGGLHVAIVVYETTQ
mmetsp:Transcript_41161/g.108740  ORF Transcript_41161/g.108740 Transcript_41161/m.108740 type:complete len:89 (-) Transcript_41161:17-283(-)